MYDDKLRVIFYCWMHELKGGIRKRTVEAALFFSLQH